MKTALFMTLIGIGCCVALAYVIFLAIKKFWKNRK